VVGLVAPSQMGPDRQSGDYRRACLVGAV